MAKISVEVIDKGSDASGEIIERKPPFKHAPIQSGELLLVSAGEYSNYEILAAFRVLKHLDLNLELELYRRSHLGLGSDHNGYCDFINTLIGNGLLEELNYRELHLDDDLNESTSDYSIKQFSPPGENR